VCVCRTVPNFTHQSLVLVVDEYGRGAAPRRGTSSIGTLVRAARRGISLTVHRVTYKESDLLRDGDSINRSISALVTEGGVCWTY
jgi:hypothetical protein